MTQYDDTNRSVFHGQRYISAEDRFDARYEIDAASGCWLWRGAPRGSNNYGRIGVNGRSMAAHRYSWERFRGEIPEGILVCHSCDTPLCVNPDHLFLGTSQDNMDDCVAKGRTNGGTKSPCVGSRNANSRLSEKDVIRIRKDLRPQRQIAGDYNVSQSIISKIQRTKVWRHI